MTLLESFVRRPVMTIMLNVALVMFGLVGLSKLPVRELPDIDPSIVNVLTVYPGANAEVVETEVTERLEEAISAADSIKLLSSTSREQVSSITVEFLQGRDVDLAAQDVRDQIGTVLGELPDDIEQPVISKQDAGAAPIMWVAFFSEQYNTQELTEIADKQVKDSLQTVPGVSSVIIGGEKKKAMRIWLDAQKMAAHNVTVNEVAQTLSAQNVELPSGRVENSDREFTVRTLGELKTAEAFNRLVIRQEGDLLVRLQDVGRAEMGVEDERAIARFKQRPAVGLGVVRQSKANTLEVAAGVKKRMKELAKELPEGVEFDFPYDESVFVGYAIKEVWQTLAIAFGLVVLTIFLFLRNVRSTFVPSLAIPVSVITTFGVLFVMGFSINTFTLLALVLAIGLVVDDAIVVLENIYRHIEDGMEPMVAAITGIKEISFAVIATTASLVAVFLPLAFIGGITGRLLLEFAISLAASVVISTIVALSLAPMAAGHLLRPIDEVEHGKVFNYLEGVFNSIAERYERSLIWALEHRGRIALYAGISLILSGLFFVNLEQEFLPAQDKGRMIGISLAPEGSTPEYTNRMIKQAEAILEENEHVNAYFAAVALGMEGPGDAKQGIFFVRLKDGERPHINDIVGGPNGFGARFWNDIEGAMTFPILPKAVDTGFEQPYKLVLVNADLQKLDAMTQQIVGRFNQEGFVANARANFGMNKPELSIEIDRDRAAALGVSVRDISQTLQILFGAQDLSSLKLDGKQYEVIAQLLRKDRLTPQDLESLYVRSSPGDLVQLSNVIRSREGTGPTVIERYSRQRSATIEATPANISLGAAMEKTETILAEVLSEDFSYYWDGEAKDLRESSGDIYLFMLMAILVVYMVLAAQFESFISPFVVMLALPLALMGAFGALWLLSWVNYAGTMLYGLAHYAPVPEAVSNIAGALTHVVPRIPSMNINIFSQVGLILLIGMVTKNSILLVEFANQQRERGLEPKEAMLKAGLIRLRPILMTSLATIAGILPIAIGFGETAESRRPLGVVAVGGLITSTILTLYVIPVAYTLLARFSKVKDHGSDTETVSEVEGQTA